MSGIYFIMSFTNLVCRDFHLLIILNWVWRRLIRLDENKINEYIQMDCMKSKMFLIFIGFPSIVNQIIQLV